MIKVHQYAMLCAPMMGQRAAVEAFKTCMEDVENMREEYNHRRRIIISRLQNMGLEIPEPKGAFYAFAACGEGFIRCSYATSVENIMEAMDRMERFVAKLIK